MKELPEDLQKFVERMGLAMERAGAARTFGRILGLLMVVDDPVSLDEMREILRVSKASVSTNARLCERAGLVLKVSKPGDRKIYYELLPNAFEITITHRVASLKEFIDIVEDGLSALDETHAKARDRLMEMHGLYTCLGEGMKNALEQWRNEKDNSTS